MLSLEAEKNLVERAKTSPEAFGELFDLYYRPIFGYALRRTADLETARDVTSVVFFQALRQIRKYEWRGISISHWLYRIANREIVDSHKRRSRMGFPRGESESEESNRGLRDEIALAASEMKRNEEFLDLHACLVRLPLRYQETITLRYFEDKDIREVAVILGKPEGTVKSLLHRGIEKLRKMMEL